jgi:hypothetical protein
MPERVIPGNGDVDRFPRIQRDASLRCRDARTGQPHAQFQPAPDQPLASGVEKEIAIAGFADGLEGCDRLLLSFG